MGKFYKHISLFLLASLLTLSLSSQTYCSPTFIGSGVHIYIVQVTVGSINHNPIQTNVIWDFTHMKTSIKAGDTIPMLVSAGRSGYYGGTSLFVDLNNDFDLTDSSELIYNFYTGSVVHSIQLTVPVNTIPGLHRMRIICNRDTTIANADPCGNIVRGSYHDYTLEVTNDCPLDSNMQVFNITDTSAQFSWAARNGIGYEYVLKTDTIDPIGIGTLISANSFDTTGLLTQQRYYFHLRTSCGNGIYSPWERISFITCDLPYAQLNVSGDVGLCKGDTILLSVPYDSNFTYQWYNNGTKLLGEKSNTFDVHLLSGKYFVAVGRSQGCFSLSDTAIVEIYNKPVPPSITIHGDTLTSSGFSTYLWYLNGWLVKIDSTGTYIPSNNGIYYVTGVDSNGCYATSETVNVTWVGIDTYNRETGIRVFPNPTPSVYSVALNQVYEQVTITIKDSFGRTISSNNYRNTNGVESRLDGSQGVYFLEIMTDQGFLGTVKVLKE